jgi:hypothetical protein
MKRGVKIASIGFASLAILAMAAAGWYLRQAMPIGAGFVAKYICSSVFISHRDPAIVFKEDVAPVNPLARWVDYHVDLEQQSVTADTLGLFTMRAIFRQGCGCTLVAGTTAELMRAQPLVAPDFNRTRPVRREELPWPQGDQGPVDPTVAGIDGARLHQAMDNAFEEVYAPRFDATQMLYGSYDFAAYAATRPLQGPPDSRWHYSSGTTNIVARVVRQTVVAHYPYYYSFMYEKFFDRIGMHSAVFEPDASGTFVGSSYLLATPRDWARFGQLYLQDGVWQGQRLLPEGWVRYTTTPTGGAPKGQYGASFWLNAGEPGNPANRRWPDAPTDAYAALGFQEQNVIIIPSRKAVLARFGATANRAAWDANRFIQNVLAALP